MVQAVSATDPEGRQSLTVTVRLPTGRRITVSGDPDDATPEDVPKQPIDVEWREVR